MMASTEETGTSVTNERWMLPLFQELGYGRLVTSKCRRSTGGDIPSSGSTTRCRFISLVAGFPWIGAPGERAGRPLRAPTAWFRNI